MPSPTKPRLIAIATPVAVFAALVALLGAINSDGSATPGAAPARLSDPARAPALTEEANAELVAHNFTGGLALAKRAHRLEPDLAATYPPLIDGLIETGRYRAAAAAIERLLNLKPGPPAYARLSYFEELHGNRGAALRAMRLAASSALPGTEAGAFGHTLVGDLLFDGGRYREAARRYRAALIGTARYPAAEAGRLNVAAATGHRRRAIAGYRELVAGRDLVEYSDELGRLLEAAGHRHAAARHYAALSEAPRRRARLGPAPRRRAGHLRGRPRIPRARHRAGQGGLEDVAQRLVGRRLRVDSSRRGPAPRGARDLG